MPYLFLTLGTVSSALVPLCGRLFRTQNASRSHVDRLYNVLVPAGGVLAWLILYLFAPSFEPTVLIYSALYGAAYFLCNVGVMGALKHGSTSLTALMLQVALVIVSVWGFFFWDTPFTVTVGVGLVLILVSLFLCIFEPGEKKNGDGSFWKWVFFAFLGFAGNGVGTIVVKYQQMDFGGEHVSLFMTFGCLFAVILSTLPLFGEEKKEWGACLRTSWYTPLLSGASTMAANGFVILTLGTNLSPAIIYPVVAVGGLMITTLISLIFFREKLRPMQWVGFLIGAVAILLLNL